MRGKLELERLLEEKTLPEKKRHTLLHEMKHLKAFKAWYMHRVEVLELQEAKGYRTESDCISVGERLIGETMKSWDRVYNEELRHENW